MRRRDIRKLLTGTAIIVVTLSLGFLGGWVVHRPSSGVLATGGRSPSEVHVVVPDLVGMHVGHAAALLRPRGLQATIVSDLASTQTGDLVQAQMPRAGSAVAQGTSVGLSVSPGPTGLIEGLRSQIDWDKSHLLDCWTAITRLVPRSKMQAIFGTADISSVLAAARNGDTLGHFVRRCASDAVP